MNTYTVTSQLRGGGEFALFMLNSCGMMSQTSSYDLYEIHRVEFMQSEFTRRHSELCRGGRDGLRRGRRLFRPQLCSCLAQGERGARQFIFRALMRFQSRDEITFYDFGPWDEIMVKSDRMN